MLKGIFGFNQIPKDNEYRQEFTTEPYNFKVIAKGIVGKKGTNYIIGKPMYLMVIW